MYEPLRKSQIFETLRVAKVDRAGAMSEAKMGRTQMAVGNAVWTQTRILVTTKDVPLLREFRLCLRRGEAFCHHHLLSSQWVVTPTWTSGNTKVVLTREEFCCHVTTRE